MKDELISEKKEEKLRQRRIKDRKSRREMKTFEDVNNNVALREKIKELDHFKAMLVGIKEPKEAPPDLINSENGIVLGSRASSLSGDETGANASSYDLKNLDQISKRKFLN